MIRPPRYLTGHGVVVSIGHSAATYEQAVMAYANGARSMTHVYNGMSPFAHRANGLEPAVCEVGHGTLPGCAALAFPYIPMQSNNPTRYSRTEALQTGTLFPGLDLPFKAAIQVRTKLPNTALVELMALDFAVTELNLYLDTHPQDQEALGLYASYIKLAKEGREKYTAKYGPLDSAELVLEDGYTWLNDPWPWELGGNG